MSKMGESLLQSLNEALAYAKGEPIEGTTVHKVTIHQVEVLTPQEVRQIRLAANMTQSVFAIVLGVSKKSVEAWEGGRSRPDGAARRLIGLMKKNPNFAEDAGIIVRQ